MSEFEYMNKYKDLISSYVKRIINNNHIDFKPVKIDETQFDLKMIFTKPEWFLELNDDLQYNIALSLRLWFKDNYYEIKSRTVERMKQ